MPNILDGVSGPVTARFAIVVSRYNEHITGKLLAGAVETLRAGSVPDDAIDVAWVPGAWEIPLVAQRMALSEQYDAVLCLGAVGLTTEQFQSGLPAGFDPNVWAEDSGINGGFPYLITLPPK